MQIILPTAALQTASPGASALGGAAVGDAAGVLAGLLGPGAEAEAAAGEGDLTQAGQAFAEWLVAASLGVKAEPAPAPALQGPPPQAALLAPPRLSGLLADPAVPQGEAATQLLQQSDLEGALTTPAPPAPPPSASSRPAPAGQPTPGLAQPVAPPTAPKPAAAPTPDVAAQPAQMAAPAALVAAAAPLAAVVAPAPDRPATRVEGRATGRGDNRAGVAAEPSALTAAKVAVPVADEAQPVAPQAAAAQTGKAGPVEAEAADGDALAKSPESADSAPDAPASSAVAVAQVALQGVRADQATVSRLASQIVQKLGAKVTQFNIVLHPAGLGKVDVRVEISPTGAITAALTFDNPQAAAELRGRSDELKSALQQAGFDLADKSLSFDLSGGSQRWAQQQENHARGLAGRAFAAAADQADDLLDAVVEAAARLQRRGPSGVDLRI